MKHSDQEGQCMSNVTALSKTRGNMEVFPCLGLSQDDLNREHHQVPYELLAVCGERLA
jgi:hypothetical protein